MEDLQIIALFFARDESAIVQTDRKYGRRLHLLSLNVTENDSDAQECVNDTYLEAWNRIPPHRPQGLFGYLAKIARHKSLDLLDRYQAQKRSAMVIALSKELEACIPAPSNIERELEREQIRSALRSFLKTLDEKNQYIFVRRYFYMDPVAQIADSMKKSEGSISASLHRSRQKLRAHLKKEGIGI